MHTEDTDRISGTIPDLALALALPESQVSDGIDQITLHDVCEVVRDSHGVVTLVSRRRRDELSERESARIRKQSERRRKSGKVDADQSQTSHTTVHDTHTRVCADSDSSSGSSLVVIAQGEEEEPRARASKSVPFEADQVRLYALMVHLPDHSKAFFDHYESVGWRHGPGDGKPIRDWQARYRRWCEDQRERDMKPKNGTKNGHTLTTTQQASRPITERLVDHGYRPDDFR
jgi:hypothetical protein